MEAADDVFVLPASYAQQRLWFIDQLDPGRATYNLPVALRLRGPLDATVLEAAANRIVARHEVLRTTFELEGGEPAQIVHPAGAISWIHHDFSASADPLAATTAALRADAAARFDLKSGPLIRFALYRMSAEDHCFLIAMHHILADGWSLGVLFRELGEAYAAAREGREDALGELEIQYADFAVWQREQLAGDTLAALEQYWAERLRAPLPVLELPTEAARPANYVDRPARRHPFRISAELARRAEVLARTEQVTPFMLYLAAFQLLLARYSGNDDVVVGSPVTGRGGGGRQLEQLIGLFVNTLVFRTDLGGALSFRTALQRVREVVLGAFAHEALPFDRVVAIAKPERDTSRTPVFQAIFALQNATAALSPEGPSLAGLAIERVGTGAEFAKFELSLTLAPDDGGYRGSIEYDGDLYAAGTIARFAGHFVRLIESAAGAPDTPVENLGLLVPEERSQVIDAFNDTHTPVPATTLHEMIEQQAATCPDAPALRFGSAIWSYDELNRRANRIAAGLRRHGVGPGVIVGLCVERSFDFPLGVLGILKAGGAWLPLDPSYPPDRLAYMLSDASVPVLLTQRPLLGRVPLAPVTCCIDDFETEDDTPAVGGASPDDLAYVIYTSGSTGQPKGAQLLHRGAVNLAVALGRTFEVTAADRILQFSALSFDASVLEIVWSLCHGASLVLAPREVIVDAESLGQLIEAHQVTGALLPTVMLRAMDAARMPSFTAVVSGGDACSSDLVNRWAPGRRFYNAYGPTEITVAATVARCTPGSSNPPPIGAPLANCRTYVLDAGGAPVPVGIPGELWIGGAGVGAGYLRRPELTAERFVADPFASAPGAQMYRSGDRVRWRADGQLDFLGRADTQVKLRGFRIELGEIEAQLAAQPGVRDAAVILREDTPGDRRLTAYVVPRDAAVPPPPAVLRAALGAALPAYMVPAVFVPLGALPLLPSGKVDRRLLPAPSAEAVLPGDFVPPVQPLELEIAGVWSRLLGIQHVGRHDDFFDLGGHSLLAVRMISEIEALSGKKISLRALLENSTVAGIARLVVTSLHEQESDDAVVLQSGGPGTPLAFVHGDVLGAGWYCRRLAPLLGTAPLLVLPTHGPEHPDAGMQIEAMAQAQIRLLRTVQPHGPYRLGGFCVGGLVAYEMARKLRAAGEEVAALILVDASSANVPFRHLEPLVRLLSFGETPEARFQRRVWWFRRFRYYAGRMRRLRQAGVPEMGRSALRVVRRLLGMPNPAAHAGRGAQVREVPNEDWGVMGRFVSRAERGYVPGPYRGMVHLIMAKEELARRPAGFKGRWEHVADKVVVHTVDGHHTNLVMPQGLPALAAAMRGCLDTGTVAE